MIYAQKPIIIIFRNRRYTFLYIKKTQKNITLGGNAKLVSKNIQVSLITIQQTV